MHHKLPVAAVLLAPLLVHSYVVVSDPQHPPHQTEQGQVGHNDCQGKYADSKGAMCQTAWINSLDDFCLFAPPTRGTIGDTEREGVAYCTQAGHGTRLIPEGTIEGAHMIHTSQFVQVTGKLKQTNIQIPAGDAGGEFDPHGADGKGNPIGGIIVGKGKDGKIVQFTEWTQFIGSDIFCIRACYPNADMRYCEHIYDEMGCEWNMPGNYDAGSFDTCNADKGEPMGVYRKNDGSTSTWHQHHQPTPSAHPAPASSQCASENTIPPAHYPTGRVRRTF